MHRVPQIKTHLLLFGPEFHSSLWVIGIIALKYRKKSNQC